MDRRHLLLIGAATLASLAAVPPAWPLGYRIGKLSNVFKVGYGCCYRCHTNWGFVDGHSTPFIFKDGDEGAFTLLGHEEKFSASGGCFPLCEACWSEITPTQRVPFYRQLFAEWERQHQLYLRTNYADPARAWKVIEQSVLEEIPKQRGPSGRLIVTYEK